MTAPTTALPPLELDAAVAFPELLYLRTAVRDSDWPGVQAFFDWLPDDNARAFAVRIASEVPGCETFLKEAATRETRSALPRVLLASRYIELAWEARSNLRAQHVSQAQFASFRSHLVQCEQILIDVTAWQPENALAWGLRLTTSMGLSLGRIESERRYAQLAKSSPHLFVAQDRMLQLLCPKWSGTWEIMFDFARRCTAAAPPGSLNPSLIAAAHIERYTMLDGAERTNYLKQQHVIDEIVAAAQKSVLHPGFQKTYGWVGAHSLFACAMSLAGELDKAAVHFRALGNLAAKYPWMALGGRAATEIAESYRTAALGRG